MKIADDLTKGNIRNQLIVLALPLILGNIFQQFYNTIDSFIIGRYISHTAFAAVGVAGNIMNLFIFVIGGCCNGISIIFAELYGERIVFVCPSLWFWLLPVLSHCLWEKYQMVLLRMWKCI